MKKQFQYTFFSHQAVKTISLSPEIKMELGEIPNVRVFMFTDEGDLTSQAVPVRYTTDTYDVTTGIEVTTNNKNGIIIID